MTLVHLLKRNLNKIAVTLIKKMVHTSRSGEVEFSAEKGGHPQHQGSVNDDDVAESFTPEKEISLCLTI